MRKDNMESKIVFLLGLCIILGFTISGAMALNTPYSLSGHIYDNNSNPLVGVNIKFTNMNSTDIIYATSTTGGEYQQDAANFLSGYYDSDNISYYCTYGVDSVTYNASIDTSDGGTLLDMYIGITPTVIDVMSIADFAKDIITPIYSFFVILIIAAFAGAIIYIIKYGAKPELLIKLSIGFIFAVILLLLALYIGETFSSF